MRFSKSVLAKIKEESKLYYKSIEYVHCPYFGENVYFTASGFHHLFYKGGGRGVLRQNKELHFRLKLLSIAPELISITTTLQEFENRNDEIQYWAFIAIIRSKKVKVIVRQTPGGNKHFFSIFPNWITRKKSDLK